MDDKIILSTSDEAAQKITVTGWVSRNGRFYGEDEDLARYDGCTHRPCQTCGEPAERSYIACKKCRKVFEKERYLKMPEKAWDGEGFLWSEALDMYFRSVEDIEDHLDSEEIDEPFDLLLVLCEPRYASQIEGDDHFCDDLPEDTELEDVAPKLSAALDALNKVIHEEKEILCWWPGKNRTSVEVKFPKKEEK